MARSKFLMAIVVGLFSISLAACGGGSPAGGGGDEDSTGLDTKDGVPGDDVPETISGNDIDKEFGPGFDTEDKDTVPGETTGQDLTDAIEQDGRDTVDVDTYVDIPPDAKEPKVCDDNGDCNGGYCMELPPGSGKFYCADLCENGCPWGWSCKDMYVGGPDAVFVCVPPFDVLCRGCGDDQDCLFSGSICIKEGAATGFCGKSCNPAKTDCPNGYECRIVKDDGGAPLAYQCAPKPGSCCAANKWMNCQDNNECTTDACVPGTGCQYNPVGDGTPCGQEIPCFTSSCSDGACTQWPIPDDLTFNAVDDDCDGETDEDVYKGLRVDHFTYGSGAATMSGGNYRLMGVMNAPSYHGVSAGGGYRVNPGMPLVQ